MAHQSRQEKHAQGPSREARISTLALTDRLPLVGASAARNQGSWGCPPPRGSRRARPLFQLLVFPQSLAFLAWGHIPPVPACPAPRPVCRWVPDPQTLH